MNILALSWKDLRHPEAGGAEYVTDRHLAMLAQGGHSVTLFCPMFGGAKPYEKFHGYEIIRKGNHLTVYLEAASYYFSSGKNRFGIVIDQINTLPFFTPLYASAGKAAFIHQMAGEYWQHETPFPISIIGRFLEPLYLSLYKHVPTITVSQSTKNDLEALGFSDVTVVHSGLSAKPLAKPAKKENLLVCVGRITRAKRVGHAIGAFAIFLKQKPDFRLAIIGTGKESLVLELKEKARALGIGGKVDFCGRISDGRRNRLVAKARALVNPSVREGWGLVVLEANAMGTPAVAYDVPGLRDSIKDGVNGALCRIQSPPELAKTMLHLADAQENGDYQKCIAYSKKFTWEKSHAGFCRALGIGKNGK